MTDKVNGVTRGALDLCHLSSPVVILLNNVVIISKN